MADDAGRSYVVVFHAQAAARLTEDDHLAIRRLQTSYGLVELVFRTKYEDVGLEANVPRNLWVDARGLAPSINHAIEAFARATSPFIPLLSVATNTAIFDLQVHLAFDNTPGLGEREYFQEFVPDERGLPRASRRINPSVSKDFFVSVSQCGEDERVIRACEQYRRALVYWGLGQELLALSHLYMGVEALTKAYLRWLCKQRGTDEAGLLPQLGIEKKALDPTIREKFIFQGDQACYQEAKNASDGFEHGFLGFDELHATARKRRDATAKYLRDAIVTLAGCDAALRGELDKNNTVIGARRFVRYLRGRLIGEGAELAAPDQEYPVIRWRSKMKRAKATPTGGLEITPEEELTPRLAEGISFKPDRFELWGPDGCKVAPGESQKINAPPSPDGRVERVVEFLQRVNRAVLPYGVGQLLEVKPYEATILAIFAECKSQFQGATLLISKGLPNEAMLVAASIQRQAQRLQYLSRTEERLPVVLGWLKNSASRNQQIRELCAKAGFDPELVRWLTVLDGDGGALEKYAAAHGFTLKDFPRPDELLDETSALTRLGCLVAEQIARGYGATYDTCTPDNTVAIDSVCRYPSYLGFVAAFAAESVLLASHSAGVIFDWPNLEGYDILLSSAQAVALI